MSFSKQNIGIVTLFIFSISIGFGALKDQEQKIDTTSKSSSSSSSSTTDSGGKYKTDTKVIGSKNEFYQKKFNPSDFNGWLSLHAKSRAVESYQSLIQKRLITKRGFVLTDIIDKEIGISYFHGDIVKITELSKAYSKNFTGYELISLLQTADVLDDNGYLVGSSTFNTSFDKNDFLLIEQNILNASYGFENKKVNQLMASDLYRLILSQSNILVIEKLQTHSYQSKSTGGFLNSLVDSIAGNAVGKIFHPDQVQTSRTLTSWSPQFNPYDFFDIYYGFNNYPNQHENRGLVGIYGQKNLSILDVSMLKVSGIDKYSFDYSSRTALLSQGSAVVPYGLMGIHYDEFRDSSGSIGFYNGYIAAGGASKFATVELGIGLAYRRGLSKNGIGFSWMFDSDFYVFNPFYIMFSSKGYAQPNFITEKNNWDYYEYQLGIGANFMNLAIEWGYQWNKLTDGWFGAAKLYF